MNGMRAKTGILLAAVGLLLSASLAADHAEPAGARLTSGTRILLDFHEKSLPEIIESLSDRTSGGVANAPVGRVAGGGPVRKPGFAPPAPPANANEGPLASITLEAPEPVLLWDALDRLVDATGNGYWIENSDPWHNHTEGLHFSPNAPRRGVANYVGPLRVELTSLQAHHETLFVHGPWVIDNQSSGMRQINARELSSVPVGASPFFAELQLQVEPGRFARLNGPVEAIEAVDERGRSLLASPDPKPVSKNLAYREIEVASSPSIYVHLQQPDGPPSQMLSRLRGRIPVVVYARRKEPLARIPLTPDQVGRSFRGGGFEFQVSKCDVQPNGRIAFYMKGQFQGDVPPEVATARAISMLFHQIESVNAEGKVMHLSSRSWGNNDHGHFDIGFTHFPGNDPNGPPTTVLIHDIDQAEMMIPFEFVNIPLP